MKNIFFKNVSVQLPIASVSVDFASPKVMGSKKIHYNLDAVFTFKSVELFLQKGVDKKNELLPVKAFFS